MQVQKSRQYKVYNCKSQSSSLHCLLKLTANCSPFNASLENNIDGFQRKLLRACIFRIIYPKIMKNADVFHQTNETLQSKIVEKRQLRWLGHALCLPKQTSAKLALAYADRKYTKPRGRPKLTSLSKMKSNLREIYKVE